MLPNEVTIVSNHAYELVAAGRRGRGEGGGEGGMERHQPGQLYEVINDAYNQVEEVAGSALEGYERMEVPHQTAGKELITLV